LEYQPVDFEIEVAREALTRVFGFEDFRPGQAEILNAVLTGENVFAVMPTGAGKSLCYQLPAILRPGLTIVVSPLIALMRDQVESLKARGIAAETLNSSNGAEDNAAIEAALRRRRFRLLYVAPERLIRPDTANLLREAGANVLAIDEAHCVSQWGHDFRPEYRNFAEIARRIGHLQIIAVTATADAPTRADIIDKLFPARPHVFLRSFDRPNLYLAMARKTNPASQIEAVIALHKGQSGIVYCSSRKNTERLSLELCRKGIHALPYHAGLDAMVRTSHQDEFLRQDGIVIVATIAFGMGIDKPNVRFVCHADLPQSIEAYYQEIGRAGRDGLPAETLTLYSEADILLRERQIRESGAPPERKRIEKRKLNALIALCESPFCRRQSLLRAFGEDSNPCGHCDVCDGRWGFFNGTLVAQKLMSAIHRTSGRFFAAHLGNLLAGRMTEAIRRQGHDLLPTFGVGKEFAPARWKSLFHQLHGAELITQDPEDRDRWVLTGAGRAVLRGEAPLQLREDVALSSQRSARLRARLAEIEATQSEDSKPSGNARFTAARPVSEVAPVPLSVNEKRLLVGLKAKRLEFARAQKLPPYVIFHDRVLIEMVRKQPRTEEELIAIPGIGTTKASRFGSAFLAVIAALRSEP